MFRILVPVDLSESSYKAGAYAMMFASQAADAQVILLHCYQDYLDEPENSRLTGGQPTSEIITDNVLRRNQTDAQNKLDKLHHTLKSKNRNPHVHLERVFMYGMPEDLIAEEVQRFKPHLLVMATKGESNIARTFFGTVSTNIAQDVKVPVLTIPEIYENNSIRRVLYATDFSKTDPHAVATLQQLLAPFGPAIECVHVTEIPDGNDSSQLEELRQSLQQSATANITYTLLPGSDVAETLQRMVSEQSIDMIALTTRSRSMLETIFSPSLTKKLLLESQVPLLIFHADDKV